MTDIEQRALHLEQQAIKASPKERLKLQPQLDHAITLLATRGHAVPSRLRCLNNTLKDEAIEDMFDNLPV